MHPSIYIKFNNLPTLSAVFCSRIMMAMILFCCLGCDEEVQTSMNTNDPTDSSVIECSSFMFESFQTILESSSTNVNNLESECTPYTEFSPATESPHIAEGPIEYEALLPSSGPHRPQWAKWGEYTSLPPQRWIHNLEHGGIVFLYHPCADPEMIEQLRTLINQVPADERGDFRWILTPSKRLRTPFAILAWEWTYEAECLDVEIAKDFIQRQYRKAPEDVAADGSYTEGWIAPRY